MIGMIDTNNDNPGYGEDPGVLHGLGLVTKYGRIETQCSKPTLNLMQSFLKDLEGGSFVEIGVFGGFSLLYNYDICMKNKIDVIGIDPFETITIFNGDEETNTAPHKVTQARIAATNRRENLEKIISSNNLNIKILKKDSNDACNLFEDNSISLLHIDGDHSYMGVKNDLNNYWPKLKSGGVIINDDYTWASCRKAIDEFSELNKDKISKTINHININKHVMIKK